MVIFEYMFKSVKLKLPNPYIWELTVFIKVKIPILNESSKLILNIESKEVITNNEKINIRTDKKYLFISFCSILESINWNFLLKILLGFELDKISFIEYLNKKNIFKNLKPELVEKKEPPITTKIKKINHKFGGELFNEKPMFVTLLVKENRILEKL